MGDNSPHLAIFCGTSEKSPARPRSQHVLGAARSSHGPQRGTATWRTTNASKEAALQMVADDGTERGKDGFVFCWHYWSVRLIPRFTIHDAFDWRVPGKKSSVQRIGMHYFPPSACIAFSPSAEDFTRYTRLRQACDSTFTRRLERRITHLLACLVAQYNR